MTKLEPLTRDICKALLDRIEGKDEVDMALEYSQNIPVPIIAHMLGVSAEDGDRFRAWVKIAFEDGIDDTEALKRSAEEINAYFMKKIVERRQQPADPSEDLVSFLLEQRLPDGNGLTNDQIGDLLRVMLLAGIDTTWSAIGIAIWHLATNPEDRERLVREPELIPTAVEEFLRAYSPTIMARLIVEDTTVAGCPMRKGEMVVMPVAAANRDPRKFSEPDRVIIDRKDNPHSAFGMGIHRCVGAPLARMEMRTALEELLKRFPEFHLDPAGEVLWSKGVVRGPRRLPLILRGPLT